MSDLFISEILVLVLILPVLLRPFFRRFQRIAGIALLPLLAFLLCFAVIAAVGLRLTFLPVLLFSFLVLLSGISRMVRLFLGLPTDWYAPAATVFSGFLLLVFAAVFGTAVFLAPESNYTASREIGRTVSVERISPGIGARFSVYFSGERTVDSDAPVVLLLGDISSGTGGRSTSALILAESGYTVIEADFTGRRDYGSGFLAFPSIRKFAALSGKILSGASLFTTDEETLQVQSKELVRLELFARRNFGSKAPLFVVSEGSGSLATLARMKAEPSLFSGVVCVVPEDFAGSFSSAPGGFRTVSAESGPLPPDAGVVAVLALTGDRKRLPGFGELGADDVLAALLLGGERDVGRLNAELSGRRIASWLAMRRNHENR